MAKKFFIDMSFPASQILDDMGYHYFQYGSRLARRSTKGRTYHKKAGDKLFKDIKADLVTRGEKGKMLAANDLLEFVTANIVLGIAYVTKNKDGNEQYAREKGAACYQRLVAFFKRYSI